MEERRREEANRWEFPSVSKLLAYGFFVGILNGYMIEYEFHVLDVPPLQNLPFCILGYFAGCASYNNRWLTDSMITSTPYNFANLQFDRDGNFFAVGSSSFFNAGQKRKRLCIVRGVCFVTCLVILTLTGIAFAQDNDGGYHNCKSMEDDPNKPTRMLEASAPGTTSMPHIAKRVAEFYVGKNTDADEVGINIPDNLPPPPPIPGDVKHFLDPVKQSLGRIAFKLVFFYSIIGLMTVTIPIVVLNYFATRFNVYNSWTRFTTVSSYSVFLIHFLFLSLFAYSYAEVVLKNPNVAKYYRKYAGDAGHKHPEDIKIKDLFFDWCEFTAISSTEFDENLLFAGWVYTVLLTTLFAWPVGRVLKAMPYLRSVL